MPLITRTMAGPVVVEVDAGNNGGFVAARGHNDAQLFAVLISFERVAFVAIICIEAALFVVDVAVMQNISNFMLIDIAALHPATGMFGIAYCGGIAIQFHACSG